MRGGCKERGKGAVRGGCKERGAGRTGVSDLLLGSRADGEGSGGW